MKKTIIVQGVFICTDSERIEHATLYGLSQRAHNYPSRTKEKRKEEGTKKAPSSKAF